LCVVLCTTEPLSVSRSFLSLRSFSFIPFLSLLLLLLFLLLASNRRAVIAAAAERTNGRTDGWMDLCACGRAYSTIAA
jgi:hypothetical protein